MSPISRQHSNSTTSSREHKSKNRPNVSRRFLATCQGSDFLRDSTWKTKWVGWRLYGGPTRWCHQSALDIVTDLKVCQNLKSPSTCQMLVESFREHIHFIFIRFGGGKCDFMSYDPFLHIVFIQCYKTILFTLCALIHEQQVLKLVTGLSGYILSKL